MFWESIKDSADADMFRAYLAQFPNGTFAALAAIKIARIEGSPDPEPRSQEVAVVVPPAGELAFDVEATDITLFAVANAAVANANVRARPATSAERLETIPAGAEVAVTGKVLGQDWYRVARAGGGEGMCTARCCKDGPAAPSRRPARRRPRTRRGRAVDALWTRSDAQRAVIAQWKDAIERRVAP